MTCIDGKWDIAQFDISNFDTICGLETNRPTRIDVTTSQIEDAIQITSEIYKPIVATKEIQKGVITTSEIEKSTVTSSSDKKSEISITE